MDIFSIAAKIKLDTAEFSSGIESAGSKVAGFSKKIGSGLAKSAKVGAAAVTAMATTTLAGIGAIVKATDSVADYGDNIDKMSQKMGISATAYQEWDAVMQHSGTSMESLKAGMKTLANAVESGNKAFGRLGITEKQIAKMNNEELFAAVIEGLQNVDDETERTYLAGQLLGRGATELGALLNQSAEETQAMKDRVHELGGVMSDEAVKSAAAYKDQLQDMKTSMSGFTRGILTDFMPMITEVMSGITDIFSGDKEEGFGKINSGIKKITDKVTKALPDLLELGGSMVTSIADGLLQNLPMLVETGAGIFKSLFDAALNGINSITELISADDGQGGGGIAGVINGAINFVVESIPDMLNAGLNLFSALLNSDNLTSIVDNIGKKLPDLITGIIGSKESGTGIAGHFDDIVDGGLDLLSHLVDDIPGIIAALGEGLGNLVAAIGEKITDKEFLKSLGQTAIALGKAIVEGIVEGIKNFGKAIKDAIEYWLNPGAKEPVIKRSGSGRYMGHEDDDLHGDYNEYREGWHKNENGTVEYYSGGGRSFEVEETQSVRPRVYGGLGVPVTSSGRSADINVNVYNANGQEIIDEVTKALNKTGVYAQ